MRLEPRKCQYCSMQIIARDIDKHESKCQKNTASAKKRRKRRSRKLAFLPHGRWATRSAVRQILCQRDAALRMSLHDHGVSMHNSLLLNFYRTNTTFIQIATTQVDTMVDKRRCWPDSPEKIHLS